VVSEIAFFVVQASQLLACRRDACTTNHDTTVAAPGWIFSLHPDTIYAFGIIDGSQEALSRNFLPGVNLL
jgi:hypothetical protein